MKPVETTKQNPLAETQKFLQSRGLDSFSFQDLADKVGIRKARAYGTTLKFLTTS